MLNCKHCTTFAQTSIQAGGIAHWQSTCLEYLKSWIPSSTKSETKQTLMETESIWCQKLIKLQEA